LLERIRLTLARFRESFVRKEGAPLDVVEDALIQADVGIKYTETIMRKIAERKGDTMEALKDELLRLLAIPKPVPDGSSPIVVMVSGVNGSGKTTTVAKLANMYRQQGSVLLASGDTYRDAGHEQLEIWANRAGVEIVGSQKGQDAAAVVHDALSKALSGNIRHVLIDTAGRLHTRADLMEELKKIVRVVRKFKDSGPDYNLLTIDANLGQNSIQQARVFTQNIGINGLVLTKYDGTAKGGAIIPICNELHMPILYLCVGEGIDDIFEFDAKDFVEALFD